MAVLPILIWPDPRLNAVCLPVAQDVASLATDMLDTMYAANGRGLACPQIGVLLRMFVMDAAWKEGAFAPQVFVNPRIIWKSDVLVNGPEGCLSLPGLTTIVARSDQLSLAWADTKARAHQQVFDGFAAICIQHECDHLDGILTIDHLPAAKQAVAETAIE